jgi:hypothetical protein
MRTSSIDIFGVHATSISVWLRHSLQVGCICLAATACSDKAAQQNAVIAGSGPSDTVPSTAGSTAAAGTASSAGTSAVPGASGAGTGAAGTAPSAGAGTAGMTAMAGSSGSAAGSGGSMPAAGAGGMAEAGAGGAAGMAAPTGPIDLAMMGPYEVVRDQPVGEGFEYPIASSDTGDGVAGCMSFAQSFGGDAQQALDFIKIPADLKMNMYSLYRPAKLEEGKKYPIITWGNGTCALPESYGVLLKHLASHGFFVIAANSRQVGSNSVMTKALDWAFAANQDSASPYFGKIDTDKVGAAGHSQGGMAAIAAARNSRVKTVIIFNGGSSASKPFLAISGDRDILGLSPASLKSAVNSASVPKAAWLWYHMVPERGNADGHLTLITEPERVVGPSTAWYKYILQNDMDAKQWLVGASCKLCGMDAMFEYGQKGL